MRLDPEKFTRQSDEVFYITSPLATIDGADIDWLKARAAETPRRRARICAHPEPKAGLHEMIIVHEKNTYVPPHRHVGRSESYTIIEGQMRIVLFDDYGNVEGVVAMAAPGEDGQFFFRLSARRYHSMLIDSDWIVFHEVTGGPFNPATTEVASWAPAPEAIGLQAVYLAELANNIDMHWNKWNG